MMKNSGLKLSIIFILSLVFILSCTGRKIESQLHWAEELKGTRKFDEALEVYKLVTSRNPNDDKTATAYLKMGDLYLYTYNKNDEALSSYSRVIQKWPLSDEAREAFSRRADIFKAGGDLRSAVNEYEQILKYFPGHQERFSVKLQIAEAYLSLNDPYQAAVELEGLLKNENIEGEVHSKALFDLGESYLFLKRFEEAFDVFKLLEGKYPEAPYMLDVHLRMVECLEQLDLLEEAISLQKKLIKLYPDSEIVKKKVEALIRREEKNEKPELEVEKGHES